MNILYLNNSIHLGGDTKCILKLCKEFNHKDNKIIIASKGGVMEEEFNNIGIKHIKINDVMNKNLINIFKIVKQIRNIVKTEEIDIIHSHHRMTTLISKFAVKNLKTQIIHSQHLCIEDKFKLTNMALKDINIVTVSEAAKSILIEKSNLDERKITTIYNTVEVDSKGEAVDSTLLELKEKGYFVVAQVSRIIDYKGVYDFVNVAKKTINNNKNKNKNIRFVLIGDGPEKENLVSYIKKQHLEDYVYLLGSKNNVIDHLKYIDLLLLCSYIEGLPLAPIEAFSQGIPVIATNIDGTNEEIKNGYNGFLVKIKDIDGFSKNIIKICEDKVLLNKLQKNAHKTYLNMFNKKDYIENHKKLYMKLQKS